MRGGVDVLVPPHREGAEGDCGEGEAEDEGLVGVEPGLAGCGGGRRRLEGGDAWWVREG